MRRRLRRILSSHIDFEKEEARSGGGSGPYSTSSRYTRWMSTSPFRFKKNTAEADIPKITRAPWRGSHYEGGQALILRCCTLPATALFW